MRYTAKTVFTASSIAVLLGSLSFGFAPKTMAEGTSAVDQGKDIAFNKKKGNCLACHDIKGGKLAGNIGPKLNNIKDRYSKSALKNQISDARSGNSHTMMPPFGPHEILSESEIDKVVEYIYTL